jgi:hypothetical protein
VSDLTPYEKELAKQLQDPPLPDENQAWQEMKLLLDRDNNKGGGKIPPSSRNMLWGLLGLIAIIGAIWLFTHNAKQVNEKKSAATNQTTVTNDQSTNATTIANKTIKIDQSVNTTTIDNAAKNKVDHSKENKEPKIAAGNVKMKKTHSLHTRNDDEDANTKKSENEVSSAPIDKRINKNYSLYVSGSKVYAKHSSHFSLSKRSSLKGMKSHINNAAQTTQYLADNKSVHTHKKGLFIITKAKNPNYHIKNAVAEDEFADQQDQTASEQKTIVTDTTTIQSVSPKKTGTDSLLVKPLLTAAKNPADTTKKNQKDQKTNKKKKAYFAAGIAAQQSVDKSCDCAYPNNLNAPAVAKDYLPSVYLRFYDKKWFLQTEFKYAAPQYVDGFAYHVIQDQALALNDTTTSFTIKKIYSQQLIASFNYFILPRLSVGTGLIYNIFSGADIEQTSVKKMFGADSLISSSMITDKDDTSFSSLAKNNLQLLLEVQYQWKRFSIGARYAIGLTPYIKYTDPYTQIPEQKENSSFNIFIRYDLWRQK